MENGGDMITMYVSFKKIKHTYIVPFIEKGCLNSNVGFLDCSTEQTRIGHSDSLPWDAET